MRILLLASDTKYALNFRGDLLKQMVDLGHEVYAVVLDRVYEKQFNNIGVKLIDISFKRTNINPFSDIAIIKKYINIFKQYKPDLIYAFTAKPVVYGCIAAGICKITEVYPLLPGLGYIFGRSGIKGKTIELIVKKLYKYSLSKAKKVFFQNNDDIEFFTSNKILLKEKCIKVNGSGVNMERYKQTSTPEKTSFLMVSRLLKNKGVIEYLNAAKVLKKKYPDIVFRLIGGFDTNPNSLNMDDIKPYIDKEVIDYKGYIEDVRPYINDCMVFVLPTYYNEGLPRTILESMAVGRAVITTAWKGGKDAVVDGETGFLIPIKNKDILIEKMEWMINNPDKAADMGIKGNLRCRKLYDVNKVNNSILKAMNLIK